MADKKINSILVRMYRLGTGDFFILQLKSDEEVAFKLMIDCGCINGSKQEFIEKVQDLNQHVKGEIDLLIITHEHADHINGFELAKDEFEKINFKKVWFAWTESKEDLFANDLRQHHAELEQSIALATLQLNNTVKSKFYETTFADEFDAALMIETKHHFIEVLNEINNLSPPSKLSFGKPKPTMEDLMRTNNVIKEGTKVEFLEPGKLIENVEGALGIRFFVLGPPKNNNSLKLKEKKGEGVEKRENPSTPNLAFLNVLAADDDFSFNNNLPFDKNYILKDTHNAHQKAPKASYKSEGNLWRNIEKDWLFSAGILALRHETSINNTSLAIAIQFIDSERILLFPGDAEHGNWLSWHENLKWTFTHKGIDKEVNAEYILNNTVFYKVGHHMSQNGTVKLKGIDMMKHDDLSAMVTLDFKKINKVWLNTMPNDLIGAELIRKTKGKVLFVGDCDKILKNIKTNRVSISQNNETILKSVNDKFKNQFFIEHEITG